MDFASSITSGIEHGPQFNVISGTHGVGKTSLAALFPKPIIADLENGSKSLNVSRITPKKIKTYKDVLEFVKWIRNGKHDYRSMTIDSLVKIESLIHRHLCGEKYDSIEKYDGGFGKGFTASREQAALLCEALIDIVEGREMDVNVIAHTQVKKQADPYDNTEYDKYLLQGNEKFTQIIESQAYNVYFLKRVVYTEQNKNKRTVASFDGQRVICTEWRPGFSAKNRLNLPAEIFLPREKDKAYEALQKAIEESKDRQKTPDELRAEIESLLVKADQETITKARERMAACGDSIADLKFIKSKVLEVAQF